MTMIVIVIMGALGVVLIGLCGEVHPSRLDMPLLPPFGNNLLQVAGVTWRRKPHMAFEDALRSRWLRPVGATLGGE